MSLGLYGSYKELPVDVNAKIVDKLKKQKDVIHQIKEMIDAIIIKEEKKKSIR